MMDDRVAGIAGHVENPEIGSQADRFVGELATVEAAWHHHVSEQKIDVFPSGLGSRAPPRRRLRLKT